MTTNELDDFFGPAIDTYTRSQALADGVLVDISETAKKVGFKIPVAVTDSVWRSCIEISIEKRGGDKQETNVKGLLINLHRAIQLNSNTDLILFKFRMITRDKKNPPLFELKAIAGGGDEGEPVITIMFPNED